MTHIDTLYTLALAACDAGIAVMRAATEGIWNLSDMVDGATIGNGLHKVWPIDALAQEDEDGFCGIGVACCILPREDENPDTLRMVPANATAIAAGHNIGLPGLVALRGQLVALWRLRDETCPQTAWEFAEAQILAICRALAEGHGPAIDALRDALGGCGGAG